jgi:hypothetical protein
MYNNFKFRCIWFCIAIVVSIHVLQLCSIYVNDDNELICFMEKDRRGEDWQRGKYGHNSQDKMLLDTIRSMAGAVLGMV